MAMSTRKTKDALDHVQNQIERILNQNGPFLSLAEAARQTGVPLPTLSDVVRNKRMMSLRLLGKFYVRLNDVELYLAQSKATPHQQTWEEMVLEVTRIGVESAVPADFSTTFRQRLYAKRTEA